MSTHIAQSLFFLNLPDVEKLVCVTVSLGETEEEPRSKQIKTCRELVLLYSDILASPLLGSFTDITVVMALGSPQHVFPGVLQCCVSYSLITRLSPRWNKAGQYLICGKDFLIEKGKLNAVGLELSISEGQLCISIKVNTVRIPPTKLEDFALPPLVLRKFYSDPECILDPSSIGGALWCHVLPSMKKGQIITISRQLPKNGLFKSYRDLQNHWNQLYGYRLPELPESEMVYCSVYFRLVGERLFTYPLSCIRLESLQHCPRVDLQGALDSFVFDFRERVKSLCGFPVHLSKKPRYCTTSLNTATSVQLLNSQQINLTSTSATRPCLLLPHLPRAFSQHPPSFLPQPVREQPSAWVSSQQDRAQSLMESPTPDSASSCISSSSLNSTLSLPLSQPGVSLTSSSINSSSSSLPLFRPVSFLTPSPSCKSSSSSSPASFLSMSSLPVSRPVSSPTFPCTSVLPRVPPFNTTSKPVSISKTKQPSQHINPALLHAQKKNEQQQKGGGGGQERTRITFPTIRINTSPFCPSSSLTAAPALSSCSSVLPRPPLPPPFVPRFKRCLKVSGRSSSSSAVLPPPPAGFHPTPPVPRIKHSINLNPTCMTKSNLLTSPVVEIKRKTTESCSSTTVGKKKKGVSDSSCKQTTTVTTQPPAEPTELLPLTVTESDVSIKGRPATSSGVKNSRGKMQNVDVEEMARNNQLSKVNSSTLLVWLKQRGVLVGTRPKKEELTLKERILCVSLRLSGLLKGMTSRSMSLCQSLPKVRKQIIIDILLCSLWPKPEKMYSFFSLIQSPQQQHVWSVMRY
ncbi:uncharacterized protein C18orf63 homolog isoform X3 [Cynoglossus semilaevis]|uniref:uncharacterized protein C18orf63 homolog isoform X3 n=1 Tax=Cynoglossus semilaevis TaxID=244447 RepID=UPI000D630B09|nr:uncharacterized protein C18orf63 homolog isoform X3 [Cynoglossus semilaevis]